MNYDQPRIWLLAAFCVAAQRDIPHGVAWATEAGGFFAPIKDKEDIGTAAMRFRRPVYGAIRSKRIRLSGDMYHNRIMTGLKLAVDPDTLNSNTASERECVLTLLDFIAPVLRSTPDAGKAEIQRLMRTVLQNKEFSLAA